ncbi:hypothetical protein [Dyadobacter crusticola]|uniref:hypothetical protein n=1 Tax=Dyadobacter crusticola TaxID=292407 RepID=UPI0004E1D842|nr:hypothetical protein [Dyadobacter crusticola]
MEKSESLEHGLPAKKRRNYTVKASKPFFVKVMPKNVSLKDFSQKLEADLSTIVDLSQRKKRITRSDIEAAQLSS